MYQLCACECKWFCKGSLRLDPSNLGVDFEWNILYSYDMQVLLYWYWFWDWFELPIEEDVFFSSRKQIGLYVVFEYVWWDKTLTYVRKSCTILWYLCVSVYSFSLKWGFDSITLSLIVFCWSLPRISRWNSFKEGRL